MGMGDEIMATGLQRNFTLRQEQKLLLATQKDS